MALMSSPLNWRPGRTPLGGVSDDEFDFHWRVSRQLGDADCRTRVSPRRAQQLNQEVRGGIDHLGLLVETGRRGDEARHLQHPGDPTEITEVRLEARQRL